MDKRKNPAGQPPPEIDDTARAVFALWDSPELGGSEAPAFNGWIAGQALNAMWFDAGIASEAEVLRMAEAVLPGLKGVAPRDPIEAMLAAQMVATHAAAMACYRRASAAEQTFAGRDAFLGHASKLVRAFAGLVEALNRHRGKGQQTVRVEHVHVHPGGRAIVGAVNHRGGGGDQESVERSHAKAVADARQPALRGADAGREPVPLARGEREAPV